MLYAVRVETIEGKDVTLTASVKADEHPGLLALEKRLAALPEPPSAMDIVNRSLLAVPSTF